VDIALAFSDTHIIGNVIKWFPDIFG
jgi:hypothetical protein